MSEGKPKDEELFAGEVFSGDQDTYRGSFFIDSQQKENELLEKGKLTLRDSLLYKPQIGETRLLCAEPSMRRHLVLITGVHNDIIDINLVEKDTKK